MNRSLENDSDAVGGIEDASARAFRLQNELISLTKICEDVLIGKTSKFPTSNVGELARAIASHNNNPDSSFISLMISELSKEFKKGSFDKDTLAIIGECLEKSGYVDRDWYLSENPDVEKNKNSAGEHYIEWGQIENRKPNQFF